MTRRAAPKMASSSAGSRGLLAKADWPPAYAIATSIALAVAAIAVMMVYAPRLTNTSPDSKLYILMARNIIAHLCYSDSPVETAACVPSWGSQPPGYPFFVMLVRLIAGDGVRPIILCQMVIFSIAAINFCRILYATHRSVVLYIVTAGAALFSPASFGWSHFILTELLSAAAVLFTFAALAHAVQTGRPRVAGISAAVVFAMMIRWDLITLLVPVLAVLSLSSGLRIAVARGAAIIAICAVPYLLMVGRAAVLGLPLFPTTIMNAEALPQGLLQFFRAAALDDRATANVAWALMSNRYSVMRLEGEPPCRPDMPHSAVPEYSPMVDPYRLCTAFERLIKVPNGEALPSALDDEFMRLRDMVSRNWFAANIGIPVERGFRMWWRWLGHPLAGLDTGRHTPIKQIFISYYLLVGAGLLIACFSRNRLLSTLALGAASFMVMRTAFLVSIPVSAMEIRYLDAFFPTVEVIALWSLWSCLMAFLQRAGISFCTEAQATNPKLSIEPKREGAG